MHEIQTHAFFSSPRKFPASDCRQFRGFCEKFFPSKFSETFHKILWEKKITRTPRWTPTLGETGNPTTSDTVGVLTDRSLVARSPREWEWEANATARQVARSMAIGEKTVGKGQQETGLWFATRTGIFTGQNSFANRWAKTTHTCYAGGKALGARKKMCAKINADF